MRRGGSIATAWCFAHVGRSSRYGLAVGSLAVLVAATACAGWAWGHTRTFVNELTQAVGVLDSLSAQPARTVSLAGRHLAAARTELEALRPLATPVAALADRLGGLPVVGLPARQVAALWTLTDAGTSLGQHLTSAAELGLVRLHGGAGEPGLVATAPALSGHLQAAMASFSRARAARADLGTLSRPFNRLDPFLSQWDAIAPRLERELPNANHLAAVLPRALGSSRPMTYLVLMQTRDDLRATGGFITTVGTVQVEQGKITALDLKKVYAAEGIEAPGPQDDGGPWPSPPSPLSRYMGLGQWRLRDANWWADFPTTARQVANFWHKLDNARVDGVIALNEEALEAVLEVTGPVQLSRGEVISANDVKEATLASVFRGTSQSQWYAAQSVFSQDLAHALVAAVERLPAERSLQLAQRLLAAAARHDLLISSFDPVVATALLELGVDGGLRGRQDDYFYLVEQNVSYGKLSPFIRQDLEYAVQLRADGRPTFATLTLDALNAYEPSKGLPGYPAGYYTGARWNPATRHLDSWEGYYGGYTRIYLPSGSRFLGAGGFDDGLTLETESNRVVIGGYVGLSMAARRRLQLEWVPNGQASVPGRYRLLVQRQPGAPAHGLTVRVALPEGYLADAATPIPAAVQDNEVIWRTTLERDQTFELTLRPTAPVAKSKP
jgi:hypothetical protein